MRRKLKAGFKMRILVDSSTLISLAKIGELGVLETIFKEIFITTVIKEEILRGEYPEREVFRGALNKWIRVINFEGNVVELRRYGLDSGEASIFLAVEPDDRLVLDEANARRFAESKGLKFTGLIGLLVAAVKTKKLAGEKAIEILNKLAKSDFRMNLDLYLWACREIERLGRKSS